MRWASFAIALFWSIAVAQSAEKSQLLPALEELEAEIKSAEAEREKYGQGAIQALIDLRIAALKNTHALLRQKAIAEQSGASFRFVQPVSKPDPERAQQILADIAVEREKLKELEADAARYNGGLAQALALLSVQTQKQTLALLRHGYYAATYGLPAPHIDERIARSRRKAEGTSQEKSPSESKTVKKPEPLDPRYPDIDYSQTFYQAAVRNGMRMHGRWAVEETTAKIDDSILVRAINVDVRDANGISTSKSLFAACSEGKTYFLIRTNAFLYSYQSQMTKVTYRIGKLNAEEEYWGIATDHRQVGKWDKDAIQFMKKISSHDTLYVRIQEKDGKLHSADFDLRGIDDVLEKISFACGWEGDRLSREEIAQVQKLLSAAGYYKGPLDGEWGSGSREALLKYQSDNKLARTGTLNLPTLESLGWKSKQANASPKPISKAAPAKKEAE